MSLGYGVHDDRFLSAKLERYSITLDSQFFKKVISVGYLHRSGQGALFIGKRLFEGDSGNRMTSGYELIRQQLDDEYGPYIPLARIWRRFSYPSLDAARKAASRGTFPVSCFQLPGRRGVFVQTADVARWVYNGYQGVARALAPPTSPQVS